MLSWVILDGDYSMHGPFADMPAIIKYVRWKPLPAPLTMLQVASGDNRPIATVVHDALAARAIRALQAAKLDRSA